MRQIAARALLLLVLCSAATADVVSADRLKAHVEKLASDEFGGRRGKGARIAEEYIRKTFPWDYVELTKKLRKRYSNFVMNNTFHKIKRDIEADERLCRTRYLDPSKPSKGMCKKFYNSNILAEYDRHYTRKE